jgi:hypothetical protein
MILIPILFAVMGCMADSNKVADYFETVKTDTINLGEYKMISEYWLLMNQYEIRHTIRINKDSTTLIRVSDFEVDIYRFCTDSMNDSLSCFAKDLDADNIREILITCFSGGQGCCRGLVVYSLEDKPRIKSQIESNYIDAQLIDFDYDSIPEYIYRDYGTIAWNDETWKSYTPLLIWKWDKSGYKLANYKFSFYVINGVVPQYSRSDLPAQDSQLISVNSYLKGYSLYDDTSAITIAGIDSAGHEHMGGFPSRYFYNAMTQLFYAGLFAQADSLIDIYWPANIPGKDYYYNDFKRRMQSEPHWKELQESKW